MNKLTQALTSRTVWVIVVMFLIGGVEAIAGVIPDNVETMILFFLGALAGYFKVNPSQDYS